MAITKIHPIKSTLNLAIDYITKSEKTDEKVLVSSFKCHPSTAHIQFIKTRKDNDTKGTVLARHLIQSFLPGEVDPIKVPKIGMNYVRVLFTRLTTYELYQIRNNYGIYMGKDMER